MATLKDKIMDILSDPEDGLKFDKRKELADAIIEIIKDHIY